MTNEELRESLFAAPKNGYTRITAEQWFTFQNRRYFQCRKPRHHTQLRPPVHDNLRPYGTPRRYTPEGCCLHRKWQESYILIYSINQKQLSK